MKNEKASGAGVTKIGLRPEACPARYLDLHEKQQDAFRRIVTLLVEAINEITTGGDSDQDGHSPRLPLWLDQRATSRLVFLDGERGMGKSTVLISLVAACSSESHLGYPEELKEGLRTIKARTVWLEPVGAEVMPSSANLLAGLLARVDQALQERIQSIGRDDEKAVDRGRGGAFGWAPDYQEALLQLQRLQNAVAISHGMVISPSVAGTSTRIAMG